jgi:hypothetical protein
MLSLIFALVAPIVFVPLDDRPVTYQLPLLLGRIAGVPITAPPRETLGTYLHFGKPDAIIAWLNGSPRSDSYVLSTDMLAYGGLVGSRVPAVTYADAYFRLHSIAQVRSRSRGAWIGAFGTVMRLAPTGVPAIGDASDFFAAGSVWPDLQAYANLHDPPIGDEVGKSQRLAARLGPALDAYLQTRIRNYSVDHLLIDLAKAGTIDRLVLGQDDAKLFGLHVKDLNALQAHVSDVSASRAVSIEPGADELGMALIARVLAGKAHWTPHIAVKYSRPDGAAYQDPLEFAPLGTTVESLIALCGGVQDDEHPDFTLVVRVPHTGDVLDDALFARLDALSRTGSVALTDVSFEETYETLGTFANRLLASGVASRLDAYSAWNTAANTIGTALGEAIAAGAGRRMHTYDRLAHQTFTFMRFADDVDFHVRVRPELNDWLAASGTPDHTLLLPDIAASASSRTNAALWNDAAATLGQLYPSLHIASMRISLPWNRTFETEIDVALAPTL